MKLDKDIHYHNLTLFDFHVFIIELKRYPTTQYPEVHLQQELTEKEEVQSIETLRLAYPIAALQLFNLHLIRPQLADTDERRRAGGVQSRYTNWPPALGCSERSLSVLRGFCRHLTAPSSLHGAFAARWRSSRLAEP